MKMNSISKIFIITVLVLFFTNCDNSKTDKKSTEKSKSTTSETTIDSHIGKLSFTHEFTKGYPTDETQQKLFDELDFQRACQAYIWATPLVSFAQWQYAHTKSFGAENGQIVFMESYDDKLGGLTFNTTTPYVISFIDLNDGPWVIEMPEAEVRGAANDFWQIGVAQMTKPGKYLFVGPGEEIPSDAKNEGFEVIQMTTMNFMPGVRLMSKDRDVRMAALEAIKIYPYSEKSNPRPRGYITPDGRAWEAWQPRGMEYWERLHDIINREPVQERDRFYMAMLKSIGIEKGKPFNPDERLTKILLQGVLVGEAMTKSLDFFNPRFPNAHYVDGSNWEYASVCSPSQRQEFHDDLDERAAWFYEAVTNDPMMHGQETGVGQVYMSAYKDGDGDWLNTAVDYELNVPANAPAKAFWSMTIYDVDTRCITINDTKQADRSSRMDLLENEDGSITLYIGPTKPEGEKAKNWIQTLPGKGWFPYFRFYSPDTPFLDKTWVLPDIEKAKK